MTVKSLNYNIVYWIIILYILIKILCINIHLKTGMKNMKNLRKINEYLIDPALAKI
jgi:hypothetical protein